MTHEDEDKQVNARLERKPHGEDDGVTLYPLSQGLDDLPERYVTRDYMGRSCIKTDEIHELLNTEAGKRLIYQFARAARSGPSTQRERARAKVIEALDSNDLSLAHKTGEPLSQSESAAVHLSAADSILEALHGFGGFIDLVESRHED